MWWRKFGLHCFQACNLWRNLFKLLSLSEQLIQPYLEGMRRTGTRLLEVQDFLRVKLDDLWFPVQKSSTSVRQRSGRCWHPARAATGCEQYGGNLNQVCKRLQACKRVKTTFRLEKMAMWICWLWQLTGQYLLSRSALLTSLTRALSQSLAEPNRAQNKAPSWAKMSRFKPQIKSYRAEPILEPTWAEPSCPCRAERQVNQCSQFHMLC